MRKLELNDDIPHAVDFLSDYAALSFYGTVSCLGQLKDKFMKESSGQFEMFALNDVLAHLQHFTDVKPTYTNGFHVNTAITRSDGLCIDETVLTQDFDNFLKCAQPIIDERALAPAEFNLIAGCMHNVSINMKTFKKNRVYMGKVQERDYYYLDVTFHVIMPN